MIYILYFPITLHDWLCSKFGTSSMKHLFILSLFEFYDLHPLFCFHFA